MAEKRPGPQAPNESCKRRAPYAARACDACRRRKGRCDGRKPCEYCLLRQIDCAYSLNSDDRRSNTASNVNSNRNAPPKSHKSHQWSNDEVSSLGGLVATMQGQLESLVAHVKMSSTENHGLDAARAAMMPVRASSNDSSNASSHTDREGSVARSPIKYSRGHSTKRPARWFHGPTSPDYSLVAAQIRIEEGTFQVGGDSGRRRLPCLDECQSDDGEEDEPLVETGDDDSDMGRQSSARQDSPPLLSFLHQISKADAIRLLRVYQEIVGELHPIRDISILLQQTEMLYSSLSGQTPPDDKDIWPDEDDLVILNLALLIAITAEAVPESYLTEIALNLYNCCRPSIDYKLTSPVSSINQVVIALLMGFYHFFKFRLRLAWRMCGLAGRIAMELGIHNRDVLQHYQESGRYREDVATLSCSILVLDRQWSAAAGLPSNFQETDFDTAQVCLASTPYLKAMMAFTLMSHKFNEPISRVAQGGHCQDEDTLEVTNFRVEQWRKRALEKHNFIHPEKWEANPAAAKAPAWTIILYLRANAVRGILLRPFFLASTNTLAKKKIQRGLEIVSDSMNILSILHRDTDIFKKQHPHLQHFLASTCALLLLIVSYTEQNRHNISPSLLGNYSESVKDSFRRAWKLSSAYSKCSKASNRLCKRLVAMREPLIRWGLISRQDDFGESSSPPVTTSTASAPAAAATTTAHTRKGSTITVADVKKVETPVKPCFRQPMVNPPESAADDFSFLDFTFTSNTTGFTDPLASFGFSNMNNDARVEYFDPLMFEYSMNSTSAFFSDGGC